MRSLASGTWSEEHPVGVSGDAAALVSYRGGLLLVARDREGALQSLEYHLTTGWSPCGKEPVATGSSGGFALAALEAGSEAMLVWRDQSGALRSRSIQKGVWQPAATVAGFTMDAASPITLTALGASLYLIFKAPGADAMSVVSYNTAPFNVVTVATNPYGGAQDDTSVNAWSPSAFPVAHFSARPDAATQNQPEPIAQPYAAGGALAAATLHGVIHLCHPSPANPLLMEETFSIAGLMTPVKPVSLKSTDATSSDGFGTLAEAGWTRQRPIHGAHSAPGSPLAMARIGGPDTGSLALLCQEQAGGHIQLWTGAYHEEP